MSPVQEVAYVSRVVALQVLSTRLAELAQNTSSTPVQEREQKQIIQFPLHADTRQPQSRVGAE